MHTDPGHAFQKFSTFLTVIPNRKPVAHSCFAPSSLLTVIKIADPRLLLTSCSSFSRSSFINQGGIVFKLIPVVDSTSLFSNSIFPGPTYLTRAIPSIFERCRCWSISTPITD